MGVDLAAEEQFGPYLVFERLGVGGMATVHRALERGIEGFERIVALKRLLPHLAEDASFIKSFVREAKLASLLNHNNVVQIFELGRVGTQYFISMEYIDGRDIRAILRHARKVTGPPPVHVTVGLLLQLCDALDYAHTRVDEKGHPLGLVHRDVSPSNVLVTSAGHVKVIDFGIARAQSQQLRTQTGRVKGKLAYMAPECISGKDLDARSDLFAVGVIAHELLTARPLFASKNEYQTLLKVQRGDILPPSSFNGACPAELDAIVLKALQRDPDERYPSAADLRDDLLRLKFKLNLTTGHRDIAQWIEWAANVEAPSAGFGAQSTVDRTGGTSKVHKTPTPRPKREEDEAVEIAWGGGGDQDNAEPVVLDDVPDVSDKHLVAQLGAAPQLDEGIDSLGDDIPAPQPSHGAARTLTRELPIPAPPDDDDGPRSHPTIAPSARKPISIPPGQRYGGPERRTSSSPPPSGVERRQAPSAPPAPPSERRGERRGPDRRSITAGPPDGVERRAGDRRVSTTDRRAAVGPISQPPAHEEAPTSERHPSSPRANTTGAVERQSSPDHEPRHARSLTDQHPLEEPALTESAAVSTKPGFVPPKNIKRSDAPNLARPSTDVAFGSAIMARQGGHKTRNLLLGLGASGAIAAGVALYLSSKGGSSPAASVAPAGAGAGISSAKRERGIVKFIIEPADSEIAIQGMDAHVGSPWQTELPPGAHSIQIQRTGHKAYLTTIELSANETQTLRVVLEQLGSQPGDEAMLALSSTPPGLEAILDGKVLPQKTPIKMPLPPGPHTIVLRQNGAEVWRHEMVAKASSDYVFNPSMAVEKQRERAQRTQAPSTIAAPVRPEPTPIAPAPPTPPPTPTTPPPDAAGPPASPPTPVPPTVVQPAPAPPVVVPRPAPQAAGPQLVAPNAVKRIAGKPPNIPKSKRADLPPVITSKVCIDVAGRVTDVQMISKVERHTSLDLIAAIRGWTYAPYKAKGAAVPVCFVVNFRVAE